jgi:hypothetical protein
MTVRHLLSGGILAVAATVLAASSASAQNYTYTVTSPTLNQTLATIGSTNVNVTGITASAPANTAGNVGLTPFFNFNRNNNTSAGTVNAQTTLTVQAFRDGVAAATTNTLIFTNDFTSTTGGLGGLTLSNFSPNFASTSFTFNFAAGGGFGASTLTLSNFSFSQATGSTGVGNSSDGLIGFTTVAITPPRVTAAPEPGSLALAATGLMGAMGMVVRRRRSSK